MPDLVGGRYELLDVIASGGMATVWRAHDTTLGRQVALKRPHPAAENDPVHARIEREAVSAAALNHPNLVTVFDSGRDALGPYLVMELIEGPALTAEPRSRSAAEVVEIGTSLAGALAAVHGAGIVHRDVKPANVLLSERGPVLTDFGIASGPAATSQLTEPGTIMATASYAAPEVLAGQTATPAADIFSLAALLYELAAGRPPFAGADRSSSAPPLDDPNLEAALRPALSDDPAGRPDAAGLKQALDASSPTSVMVPEAGTTRTMPVVAAAAADSTGPRIGSALWPMLALGAVVVAFVLAAPALFGAEPEPVTTIPAPAVTTTPVPPTTLEAPTTTLATVPTTIPATTVIADVVESARQRLADALEDVHPSQLNPKESRDILAKVDEAIALAADDTDKASRSLNEAARKIDDKVEDPWRSEALAAFEEIASALSLDFDPDSGQGGGDDDDDDDD
ncbi:MAG TPA: serine/threonine-protein kinase [Acidimicrobiia bacterium]|nr:serine/threonine-protein kinase [Acidimicrobiia bacterium]